MVRYGGGRNSKMSEIEALETLDEFHDEITLFVMFSDAQLAGFG